MGHQVLHFPAPLCRRTSDVREPPTRGGPSSGTSLSHLCKRDNTFRNAIHCQWTTSLLFSIAFANFGIFSSSNFYLFLVTLEYVSERPDPDPNNLSGEAKTPHRQRPSWAQSSYPCSQSVRYTLFARLLCDLIVCSAQLEWTLTMCPNLFLVHDHHGTPTQLARLALRQFTGGALNHGNLESSADILKESRSKCCILLELASSNTSW